MKMKRLVTMIALVSVLALMGACATQDNGSVPDATPAVEQTQVISADERTITAEQAKQRIDSAEDVFIVDVRTQSEYDQQHIEGAILIPNETITDAMPDQLPDLDAEILIYCRSGNRSRQALEKLIALGYTQVYDFGGIIDWPYETVSAGE